MKEGFRCPKCRRAVPSGAPDFPFCSERCRLVDLGRWFDEAYRVSRPVIPSFYDESLSADLDLELGDGSDEED